MLILQIAAGVILGIIGLYALGALAVLAGVVIGAIFSRETPEPKAEKPPRTIFGVPPDHRI